MYVFILSQRTRVLVSIMCRVINITNVNNSINRPEPFREMLMNPLD